MSGTTAPAPPQDRQISGPRQWIRRLSLIVGNATQALDLSDFHVTFKVMQNEIQTPNAAYITIFNLAPKTAELIKREFTRVRLSAGYVEGNFGLLFDGQVKQVRIGRENATDTYVEILAADSDVIYNYATISVSLAAGSTAEDVLRATVTAINQFVRVPRAAGLSQADIDRAGDSFTVTLGPIPPGLTMQPLPRARVLFGMVREVIRQVATMLGCNWTILNRVLTLTPITGYVEGDVIVLNSRSGIVRFPEQTQDGISATALINAGIQVGRRVKLDNASVQQARFDLSYTGEVRNSMLPSIANDGMYRVLAVDWVGDTRGQDWYANMILLSLDPTATVPISAAQRGRIIPP